MFELYPLSSPLEIFLSFSGSIKRPAPHSLLHPSPLAHFPISLLGVLNNNSQRHIDPQARWISGGFGAVQKSSSSKATAILAHRAYVQYVSAE